MDLFVAAAKGVRWGWLRHLPPTWRATPLRRAIQSFTLALYLYLFFYVCWPYAEAFSNRLFYDKVSPPVQLLLWLDPLVGLSTAVAARAWDVGLWGALLILAMSLIIPRGFCGYLCPLGTLIDVFDATIGKIFRKCHLKSIPSWTKLRFPFLALIMTGSVVGILLSGFLAPMPVLTRGLLFTGGYMQLGVLKHWSMVPVFSTAVIFSIVMFGGIFLLSFLGPRFWCRYVCPTGALLSLPALGRLSRRTVTDACNQCGACVRVCPFDAINSDFSTRVINCSFCQSCAGTCPQEAIHFELLPARLVPEARSGLAGRGTGGLSRRALLGGSISGAAVGLGIEASGARKKPIRPPGSVSEEHFLDLCIRCGQCLKVCPGPVLQAAGLAHGFDSLWTPIARFTHAGCHQECNFCTQVCPTHAIVPLTLAAKRKFQMGVAVIDTKLCLPHKGERDCELCFDECTAAGYHAIQMRSIKLAIGEVPEGAFSTSEVEEMGRIKAPFVDATLCIGCGLCEYRCHAANVRQRNFITKSAIEIIPPDLERIVTARD